MEGAALGVAGSAAQNLGISGFISKKAGHVFFRHTKKAEARSDAEHLFSLAAQLIRVCPRGHRFNETSSQWLLHVRELIHNWESLVENMDKERWTELGADIDQLELARLYGKAGTPAEFTGKNKIKSWNLPKKGRTSAKISQRALKLIDRYTKDLIMGDPTKVYEPVEGCSQCQLMPEFISLECRSETMDKIKSSIHNHRKHFTQIYGPAGIGKTAMLVEIAKQIGHMFKRVVHVEVSRSPDILEIQQEIAAKLGISLEGTSEQKDVKRRADRLVEGIKNIGGKDDKVLIVLDDVWEYPSIKEIGIPSEGKVKVVIGTRISNLPLNYDDNKISVGFLTKEDSWVFFKKAARLDGSEDFIVPAEDVKRQCFGLPLALAVIGSTLSGEVNPRKWKDALDHLKKSQIKEISGEGDATTKFLCKVIEYSYKHLHTNKVARAKADTMARKIFRLCCLFPENHKIPREDLKKYLIAEDPELKSEDFNSAILRLIECHLLKSTPEKGILRMHAVVRDVAVYIAKEEDSAFINCGTAAAEIQLSEEIVTSNKKVSVMGSNIKKTVGFQEIKGFKKIWGKAECAKVQTLLLRKNTQLSDLPKSFFEKMEDLTVLDLSYSEITKLPASMKKLEKVRTLVLNGCKKLQEVEEIVALKGLLVLSLRESALTSLPTGMKNLVNLIVLDLSPAENCKIEAGFFRGLPQLQELFLVSKSLSDQAFMEIIELQNMKVLRLCVYNKVLSSFEFVNKFENGTPLPEWSEFTMFFRKEDNPPAPVPVLALHPAPASAFAISSHLNYHPMSLKKNLHIKDLDTANGGVKLLLQEAEHLIIEKCFLPPQGIHSDLTEATGVSIFTRTKILHLQNCGKIQYLSSGGSSQWENLEVLELTGLEEFKGIFKGTVSASSFAIVREITFRTCRKICSVMPDNVVQKVQKKLQKMTVIKCDMVKYIFDHYPKYSGSFSVLKLIELRGLLILTTIWKEIPPQGTFAKLKELIVIDCNQLSSVFTSTLAAMLTGLQKLTVENNKGLEAIVQWDGTDNLNRQVFPSVTHLSIQNLENLKYFHGEPRDIDLEWPSLVQLRLGGCHALTRFPIGQASAPYMTLVHVTSKIDKPSTWYRELERTAPQFELRNLNSVAYDYTEEDE